MTQHFGWNRYPKRHDSQHAHLALGRGWERVETRGDCTSNDVLKQQWILDKLIVGFLPRLSRERGSSYIGRGANQAEGQWKEATTPGHLPPTLSISQAGMDVYKCLEYVVQLLTLNACQC